MMSQLLDTVGRLKAQDGKMDDLLRYPIRSWRGGISEHGNKGPRGSFRYGEHINIREGLDTLKCNQKLIKESENVITDLPLAMVRASDENIYAFGDNGECYRRNQKVLQFLNEAPEVCDPTLEKCLSLTKDRQLNSREYAYIENANQTGLNFESDFTVEGWIRFRSKDSTATGTIIRKWSTGNYQYGLQCFNIGTTLTFVIFIRGESPTAGTSIAQKNVTALEPDVWGHFAVVYDESAGTMELIWNGVSQGTASGLKTNIQKTDVAGAFFIGRGSMGDDSAGIWEKQDTQVDPNFDLALLRMWSVARTESQVNDNKCVILGATANLVAEWVMNGNLNDNSGNNNNLIGKTERWQKVLAHSSGKITGATEFTTQELGEILVISTQDKYFRISLKDAFTWNSWTGLTTDISTFENGTLRDGLMHTIRNSQGVCLIADGKNMAMFDYDGANNKTALTLEDGNKAKSLLDIGDAILIGTQSEVKKANIFTWNRLSDSWDKKDSAQGEIVNGMEFLEGGVVAQVGNGGKIRFYNYSESTPFRVIPETEWVYPNGVVQKNGIVYLGMNGGDKNGVYSIGRIDKNDPIAVNLEYIPSAGQDSEIGAICTDGDNLFVAWKNGTSYGVDVIDMENKADATFESLIYDADRPEIEKSFSHVKVVCNPLPEGCEIKVKYRTTRESGEEEDGWNSAEMSDGRDSINGEGETKGIFNIEAYGEEYEVRVELYSNGNDGPEVRSITTFYNGDNDL